MPHKNPTRDPRHLASEDSLNPDIRKLKALSIHEFCMLTGLGRTTVHKLIQSGQLPSKKAQRRRLIPLDAALAWLAGGKL